MTLDSKAGIEIVDFIYIIQIGVWYSKADSQLILFIRAIPSLTKSHPTLILASFVRLGPSYAGVRVRSRPDEKIGTTEEKFRCPSYLYRKV